MTNFKVTRDRNGNRVVKVYGEGFRGFLIQSNGNLPKTHRDGLGPWTEGEVRTYVRSYGTDHQRDAIGI